jgi:uncharacterized NAD-dependent epimerase/dehydratase family protein
MAGSGVFEGFEPHRQPPLRELVELHERIALRARPARVAAVAVNTRLIAGDDEARRAVEQVAAETGLPAFEPVRFGAAPLLDAVLAVLP